MKFSKVVFGLMLLGTITETAYAATPECDTAISTAVDFMKATYGVSGNEVLVNVTSATKKAGPEYALVDVRANTGQHYCEFKLAATRFAGKSCAWYFSSLSCDTQGVSKAKIVDEPSWAREKAENALLIQNMHRAGDLIKQGYEDTKRASAGTTNDDQ